MRLVNRIVSLLLVPCLVGDPTFASTVGAGLVPARNDMNMRPCLFGGPAQGRPLQFLFASQALAEQEVAAFHEVGEELPAEVAREMAAAGRFEEALALLKLPAVVSIEEAGSTASLKTFIRNLQAAYQNIQSLRDNGDLAQWDRGAFGSAIRGMDDWSFGIFLPLVAKLLDETLDPWQERWPKDRHTVTEWEIQRAAFLLQMLHVMAEYLPLHPPASGLPLQSLKNARHPNYFQFLEAVGLQGRLERIWRYLRDHPNSMPEDPYTGYDVALSLVSHYHEPDISAVQQVVRAHYKSRMDEIARLSEQILEDSLRDTGALPSSLKVEATDFRKFIRRTNLVKMPAREENPHRQAVQRTSIVKDIRRLSGTSNQWKIRTPETGTVSARYGDDLSGVILTAGPKGWSLHLPYGPGPEDGFLEIAYDQPWKRLILKDHQGNNATLVMDDPYVTMAGKKEPLRIEIDLDLSKVQFSPRMGFLTEGVVGDLMWKLHLHFVSNPTPGPGIGNPSTRPGPEGLKSPGPSTVKPWTPLSGPKIARINAAQQKIPKRREIFGSSIDVWRDLLLYRIAKAKRGPSAKTLGGLFIGMLALTALAGNGWSQVAQITSQLPEPVGASGGIGHVIQVLLSVLALAIPAAAVYGPGRYGLPNRPGPEAELIAEARRLMRRDEYELAWGVIEQGRVLYPRNPILLGLAAITAAYLEDFDTAVDLAYQAVKRTPHDPHAWGILGNVLYMAGDIEEALRANAEEIQHQPHRPQGYGFRAQLFLSLWEITQNPADLAHAVTNSLTEITINPTNSSAHGLLSRLYEHQGLLGKAIAEREKEVDLIPWGVKARYRLFVLYWKQLDHLLGRSALASARQLLQQAARRLQDTDAAKLQGLLKAAEEAA